MTQTEAQFVRKALALLHEARRERELGSPYAMGLEAQAREILACLLTAQEPGKGA